MDKLKEIVSNEKVKGAIAIVAAVIMFLRQIILTC